MKLGRIEGTVVSSQKDEGIAGFELFLVRDLDLDLKPRATFVVAADVVGAGVGEVVLYASGSSARQTPETDGRPVDAVVMAIVDQVVVGDELRYDKASDP